MRSRIIVIARDAGLRARLAQLLRRGGYRAEVAESLAHAHRAGLDGFALAIVANGPDAPQAAAIEELRAGIGRVLVVASGRGLYAGPDVIDLSDEPRLLAHVAEALAPRPAAKTVEGALEFAGYRFDLAGHCLTGPAGKEIPLTPGEFGLLRAFVERAGRVLSRDRLLQLIAGRGAELYDRTIDMHVARLRRKIEPDPKRPSLIVTVPGSGYKFAAKVTDATSETRKIAAILAADMAGFGRLVGADEDRTLARLRALRSDLIDPAVAVHRGRMVKRTGDGAIVEFQSVVDAVRCALEVQDGMIERNAGLPAERRIQFRIGVHLGSVVAEADGDLMGDSVNIAARLEGVCEPGGICLSSAAYEHVRDRLKETFVDLGEKMLKNMSRPVRIYALAARSAGTPEPPASAEKGGAPRLSIVVLPFANIGGDPEQEYFADGVTESLTTDLSRISGSFVIGRNTAFTYKGKPVDARAIGRELNVRYVMEGSVQRSGARLRVNAQLIDADNGAHLWAERFDKPLADLFDMQDEIVARLARALNTELVRAEARSAERALKPDSMDLYFQGMAWYNQGLTTECLAEARGFFERAVALDPRNVDALVGLGVVDMAAAATFMAGDWAARFASAEAALAAALHLAPDHAPAHLWIGIAQIYTNRAARGSAECERALALDRNLANAHSYIGLAKLVSGYAEETEAHVKEALRLSPRDNRAFVWIQFVGTAKILLGSDEEAVSSFQRVIEIDRNYPVAYFYLAAALAHLERLEEARSAVRTGLALRPDFTLARFRVGALSDNARYLAARERIYDGMRKAGLPEG
jgi:TolB-like protein/DNA-binding response OmpR family regulator